MVLCADSLTFLDMSMYEDYAGQIVSVAAPDGASVDVLLDLQRMTEAITSEVASSSSTGYLRSWRRFASYAASNGMVFLPAKVETVLAYFGNLARFNSYSAILNAKAAIRHFHKLHSPEEPSPTELHVVAQAMRGLERMIKPAENRKLGLSKENLHLFLDYLLPEGIEDASFRQLRDAAIFSLMFFAAERLDDIKDMKIGHLRFKDDHLKCGLQRLKNQRSDSDVSIVCVAEHELDPLSTVKLVKRLVIMRVMDHKAKEDDVLFPAMRGKAVENRAVSYGAVAGVFKSMLLGLGWSLQEARRFGLHSFRIVAFTAVVVSGFLTEDQLRRAGRWRVTAMIAQYNHPSV